ncbi:MAG: MGMT family protein, partial [Clostridia bacterium]|nr:MGMT family protein [Clostridia bacterium]
SKLIDLFGEEEYVLVDIEDAQGEFVGKVRASYETVLEDIVEKCTNPNVFKQSQTKEMMEYVREQYHDELEFLWEKFDNNAIWRNSKNQKWYGALLTVKEDRLGGGKEKEIEILDLRYQKEEIDSIIDNQKIFPGYHMNKKSWITVKLDYSLENSEIEKLIDNSYDLSIGTKSGETVNLLMQKMLDYLTTIPKGKVVTYKQVAEFLGNKGLARVVGNMLHQNPDGDKYPCYKVLNSKGELAEAFVFGGKNVQKERLEKDGIKVEKGKVDLKIYQWQEKEK